MARTTSSPVQQWDAKTRQQFWREIDALKVPHDKHIKLARRSTKYTKKTVNKKNSKKILEWGKERLAEMHETLYADNKHSLLIVFQAMDTGGKDSAIKHIMSGLNPQGVKVTPFKHPSTEELDHSFLWRHYKALPPRGEIGIFNRSHYENVLISRVHPELVLAENLPGVDSVANVNERFWKERYNTINKFEDITTANGTLILKFFLHISKEEQKERLVSRIDNADKNWKFSLSDMKERAYWDDYQHAYESALNATSTKKAPWFTIPADSKWYARLAIAAIIYRQMLRLDLSYPTVSDAQRERLQEAREQLLEGRA